jgi:hypothetical protein
VFKWPRSLPFEVTPTMSRKITDSPNVQSIVEGGCTQLPSGRNFKNLRRVAWVRLRFGRASKLYLTLRRLSRIFAPSNSGLSGHQKNRAAQRLIVSLKLN